MFLICPSNFVFNFTVVIFPRIKHVSIFGSPRMQQCFLQPRVMCHLIKNHKNTHLCYLLISISQFDFALKASTLMSITLWMLSCVHGHANSANFSVFSIKRETVFFQPLELSASLGRCPHHWIAAYLSMPLLRSETVSQGTNSHIILIPAGVCH